MANEREPGMVPWDFFFSFKGRITRAQYWLDYQLPVMTSAVLMVRLVEETSPDGTIESMPGWVLAGVLLGFGFFAVFGLAASVKRWHDRDMSGWWVLIALIPVFGPIVAFICTELSARNAGRESLWSGSAGANRGPRTVDTGETPFDRGEDRAGGPAGSSAS